MSQAILTMIGKVSHRGMATGGSNTTLVDAKRVFLADMLNGKMIKIEIGGKEYFTTITDTADSTITFAGLADSAAPVAGTPYQIIFP
jgi:hypothetical protein